jgi:hypothetical protein
LYKVNKNETVLFSVVYICRSGRKSRKQRDEAYFGIPRIPEVIEGPTEEMSPQKRLNKKINKE